MGYLRGHWQAIRSGSLNNKIKYKNRQTLDQIDVETLKQKGGQTLASDGLQDRQLESTTTSMPVSSQVTIKGILRVLFTPCSAMPNRLYT